MNALIKKLLDIAEKEVGIREEGGNNNGARIREYQASTWLKPASWPWCAAFCCWVMREWLRDSEVLSLLSDTLAPGIDAKGAEKWRCQDASAFGWEKWATKKGIQVLPETEKAKAGDFVVFDFSHIGIVTKDQEGDFIETIEGNTNGKGERDSTSGDGVWRKKRHFSLTKSYIRFV